MVRKSFWTTPYETYDLTSAHKVSPSPETDDRLHGLVAGGLSSSKSGSGSRFPAGSKLPRALAPPHDEIWLWLLWYIVLMIILDYLVKF